MSILTARGKERKSRRDVPIHRMGFSPPFICIPLYVYSYIWSNLTSAAQGIFLFSWVTVS